MGLINSTSLNLTIQKMAAGRDKEAGHHIKVIFLLSTSSANKQYTHDAYLTEPHLVAIAIGQGQSGPRLNMYVDRRSYQHFNHGPDKESATFHNDK